MKLYKADLHTHTVLSPCGDLDMSPARIVSVAKERGIDILGITDHNSTRQCEVMKEVARKQDLYVLCGAEVTTREEVHCLAFFEEPQQLKAFDAYVYDHLDNFPNHPDKFGYQVVVDQQEMIVEQPEKLLISATDLSVEVLESKVHEMGGLFIPAHIDRMRNGIIGQLGLIPPDLQVDALELSPHVSLKDFKEQNPHYANYTYIQSSDAHYIKDIGAVHTLFDIQHPSFAEIQLALQGLEGRKVKL